MVPSRNAIGAKVTEALMNLVLSVPTSNEADSANPEERINQIVTKAARATATISGAAALVPGPLGLLTLLPDMLSIWRVQAQMVADVAAVYGKTGTLGREQMLWCLFKHSLGHLARDLVVQVGERYIVRRRSLQLIQKVLGILGVKIAQRLLGRTLARYIPVLGAVAVARYAFADTKKVGSNARLLFSKKTAIEEENEG